MQTEKRNTESMLDIDKVASVSTGDSVARRREGGDGRKEQKRF